MQRAVRAVWVPAAERPVWDSVSVGGVTDLSTDTLQPYTGQKEPSGGDKCSVRWGLQILASVQAVGERLCPEPDIRYILSHHQSPQDCAESPGTLCWRPSILIKEELDPETLVGWLHCYFVTGTRLRPLASLH